MAKGMKNFTNVSQTYDNCTGFLAQLNVSSIVGQATSGPRFDFTASFLAHLNRYLAEFFRNESLQFIDVAGITSSNLLFQLSPQEKVRWRQVRRTRRPSEVTTPSNPTVFEIFVQPCPNSGGKVGRRTVMLEDDVVKV